MHQKGFINIALIIAAIVVIGAGSYFVYTKQNAVYLTPPAVDNSQCNVDPDANGKCPAGCVNYGVPLNCVTQEYYDKCQRGDTVCPL